MCVHYQFQEERLAVAVLSITPLTDIIEETGRYAHTRQVYGAPLINNQVVHFRLAELATEVEALKALIYRAIGERVIALLVEKTNGR